MGQTIWILGDQVCHEHPALAAGSRTDDRVLMIESRARGAHLRYHRHKLVLVYAAMRHFADELRADGWSVDYHELADTADFSEGWTRHRGDFKADGIVMAEPNNGFERDAVTAVAKKFSLPLTLLPPVQFLVGREEFLAWARGKKRLLMETHYRRMRRELGILVDDQGEPEGGAWNFDAENRKTFAQWRKDGVGAPPPPRAKPDAITRNVMADVERFFPDAPGDVAAFWLPVTRKEALKWLNDFVDERLGNFGDYEDAMVAGEPVLFHSVLSPLINLGLLLPRECVDAAVAAWRDGRAPLPAVEGFVRQIIGWREFVNGVYWLKMPGYVNGNGLNAHRALPAFFTTGETDLNCLREVLGQVLAMGYNHHIQRLMILGNFLLLAGVNPREALRWYSEMYVDAHEWVMAANVIGMALHADGGFMATKPYAGAAGYISKMSNYCEACRYDPKKKSGEGACPFNVLYWAFFDRHQDRFAHNPRTAMLVRGWQKREASERRKIVEQAEEFLAGL